MMKEIIERLKVFFIFVGIGIVVFIVAYIVGLINSKVRRISFRLYRSDYIASLIIAAILAVIYGFFPALCILIFGTGDKEDEKADD